MLSEAADGGHQGLVRGCAEHRLEPNETSMVVGCAMRVAALLIGLLGLRMGEVAIGRVHGMRHGRGRGQCLLARKTTQGGRWNEHTAIVLAPFYLLVSIRLFDPTEAYSGGTRRSYTSRALDVVRLQKVCSYLSLDTVPFADRPSVLPPLEASRIAGSDSAPVAVQFFLFVMVSPMYLSTLGS